VTTNLDQGRPPAWHNSELFSFVEECWNNSLAAAAHKGIACQRLTEIDSIFSEMQSRLKPSTIEELVPSLLFVRAFVAYRASVMVMLSLPTDAFPLLRSALENAGYALLLKGDRELAEAWLRRDDNDQTKKVVRDKFTSKQIKNAISAKNQQLSGIYSALYERTIDWGAHPNEKALTPSLERQSFHAGSKQIQIKMLGESGVSLDHVLHSAAQIGICVARIFQVTLAALSGDDLRVRIEQLSKGL
jgi:hypothetical protein